MSEWVREGLALLGIDGLEQPLWLVAGLIASAGMLVWSARAPATSIPWPAHPEAEAAGARHFDPVAVLARVLRAGALCALAVVLCRIGSCFARFRHGER